jgi:hypothetical protein
MRRPALLAALATLVTGLTVVVAPAASAAVAPDAPGYVDATTPGAGEIRLSWPAPYDGGSPITDYEIQVTNDTTGDAPSVIDTQSTTRAHTVTGLVDGDWYDLAVAAVNTAGTSGWSDPNQLQSVPGLFSYKDGRYKVSWVDGKPSWDVGAFVDKYPVNVTEGRLCASLNYPGDPHGSLFCSNAQYQGTIQAPTKTVWYGKVPLGQAMSIYGVPYDASNNVYGDPGWVTVPANRLTSQATRTVAKGTKVVLSTHLTNTNGDLLDSRILLLMACRSGSCTKIAEPTTNSKAIARHTVTVEASTTYRWRTGLNSTGTGVLPAFAADVVRVG